ncbi:MAG TPA: response regulator, partial [Thermoanaerobaculia bacterium]
MEAVATAEESRLLDLLKQGVAAARSGDVAAARQQLLQAIGEKADYEVPWLWLAWVTADPEEASLYLRRALAINPDHRQARERRAQLGGDVPRTAAWRCPFCGRTAAERQARCAGCRTLVAGREVEAWLALPPADRPQLRASVAYFESPLAKTGQPIWHWTLGIAHLNLGNFPRAHAHLRSAGAGSPGNGAVGRLADLLASWLEREGASVGAAMTAGVPHPAGNGAAPLAAPIVPAAPLAPFAPAGRLILVVDDSPTVRKIVAVTLETQGHRAVVAADGMQAIAKLDEMIPDLVFLDIALPRIDGYRVCRLIKSNERTARVPVVLLSGKDGFFDRIRGRAAGADDHIGKPVDRATLL